MFVKVLDISNLVSMNERRKKVSCISYYYILNESKKKQTLKYFFKTFFNLLKSLHKYCFRFFFIWKKLKIELLLSLILVVKRFPTMLQT